MNVDVIELQQRLIDPDADFQQPLDAVRMALVLFVKTCFLGRTKRRRSHPSYSSWWRNWVSLTVFHEKICVLDDPLVSVLRHPFSTFWERQSALTFLWFSHSFASGFLTLYWLVLCYIIP